MDSSLSDRTNIKAIKVDFFAHTMDESKMPSKTRSSRVPARVSEYPSNFQAFATSALATVGTYENIHHWANSQANRFVAAMPRCPYTVSEVASDLLITYRHFQETTQRLAAPDVFTANGDPTMAEAALGKAQFNSFMFKEFDLWFSAFEAEAAELGTSAEECWTFQTAKKLSTRTGLSNTYLTAVIGAWLLSHQKV